MQRGSSRTRTTARGDECPSALGMWIEGGGARTFEQASLEIGGRNCNEIPLFLHDNLAPSGALQADVSTSTTLEGGN